ncbi:MAG: hypothetical protein ACI4TU_08470 [Candidatus Cryptobacteroides sp.]
MNTKKKVYAFYITITALAVLAMMVFDLNLMAKSILCLIVFFCLLVMRSIRNAYQLPDDIDPDTMQPVGSVLESEKEVTEAQSDHSSNIDLYLRLLIEADEKLSKDPEIDQMSPSYNIQLNRYIAERLESLETHTEHSSNNKND